MKEKIAESGLASSKELGSKRKLANKIKRFRHLIDDRIPVGQIPNSWKEQKGVNGRYTQEECKLIDRLLKKVGNAMVDPDKVTAKDLRFMINNEFTLKALLGTVRMSDEDVVILRNFFDGNYNKGNNS